MRFILRTCMHLLLLSSLSCIQAKFEGLRSWWPSTSEKKKTESAVRKPVVRHEGDGITNLLRHSGQNDPSGLARAFARQTLHDRRWQQERAYKKRQETDRLRIYSAGAIIASFVGLKLVQTLVERPNADDADASKWRKTLFNPEFERFVTVVPAVVWASNILVSMRPSDEDLQDYKERADAAERVLEDLVDQRDKLS